LDKYPSADPAAMVPSSKTPSASSLTQSSIHPYHPYSWMWHQLHLHMLQCPRLQGQFLPCQRNWDQINLLCQTIHVFSLFLHRKEIYRAEDWLCGEKHIEHMKYIKRAVPNRDKILFLSLLHSYVYIINQ
jgi:hypothetical protein